MRRRLPQTRAGSIHLGERGADLGVGIEVAVKAGQRGTGKARLRGL